MELFGVFGFALASVYLYSFLKQYNQTFAIAISAVCCAIVLVFAIEMAMPVIELIDTLAQNVQLSNFSVLYKAIAFTLLTQFAQDLCTEAGQITLAGTVEFFGKIAIIIVAIPLIMSLTEIVTELLR